MRPPRLKPLLAICISWVASAQTHAQPLFSSNECIEYIVANSDIVVVGKLLELGGEGRSDRGEWREATIGVEETLKGEHGRRLSVRLPYRLPVIARWKDRSCRLLVAVTGNPPTSIRVIDLTDEKWGALAADFTFLRKPEDVIRVARETVRRMPGVTRIQSFGLSVPREAIAGTGWEECYGTGGYLGLTVPVDERLEKRAQEFILSREMLRRGEGAQALRYFKSVENIARVKSLLDDPEWAYQHMAQENEGLEVRIYVVRQAAYETLQYWGVDAKMPVITEETLKLDEVKTSALSNMNVTDADLKALVRFKNLEDLFLWNVPVTDASVKVIGELKTLQNLYLGGTEVTDEGLKHLAGLQNLRFLDLRTTKVSDSGLKVLAGYKSLKKLDLGQTRVTEEGVAEFRKLRPEVEIER
jgi:Leucine Rich repeat